MRSIESMHPGGLKDARELGLVVCADRKHWTLTERGQAVAEGRMRVVKQGPKARRLVATWLAALPDGLRLA